MSFWREVIVTADYGRVEVRGIGAVRTLVRISPFGCASVPRVTKLQATW